MVNWHYSINPPLFLNIKWWLAYKWHTSVYKIKQNAVIFANIFKMTVWNLHLFFPPYTISTSKKEQVLTFPCGSPGCFYLIFHFICSQPPVYGVHDAVALVAAAPAVEAGHDDALRARQVRGPAEPEGLVYFLTAGSCIPWGKMPQNPGIYSPCILTSSIWNIITADNFGL